MTKTNLVGEIVKKQSYLCVGLDSDCDKLPKGFSKDAKGVIDFNKAIIDATAAHCVSYKINTAFYESMGVKGWQALEETLAHIPSSHFTIADAKRGDIGNTSAHYAKTFFEILPFDAITVAPYMGKDSIDPFLAYTNKCTIVLGLTSNEGSQNFEQQKLASGQYLYESVLEQVATWGSADQVMFVVGATKAKEFESIRKIIPAHFILVPGVGAQGGSLEEVTKYGKNKEVGLLVNASRAIIFASSENDFAEKAAIAAQQYAAEMKSLLK
ncbi:MAG: orotidine-5'-phosphate decarboxylase [Bacteroidetes bacterium]|jgi:orotidine-5'-phosphate decarboxylase|nr:orotidine-5'-phosphate decarboxylase [Bacteroidota bacterium]